MRFATSSFIEFCAVRALASAAARPAESALASFGFIRAACVFASKARVRSAIQIVSVVFESLVLRVGETFGKASQQASVTGMNSFICQVYRRCARPAFLLCRAIRARIVARRTRTQKTRTRSRNCELPIFISSSSFWCACCFFDSFLSKKSAPSLPLGRDSANNKTPKRIATWLILPVVICLSQRLSHACLSINCLYCETANGSLNQL